MTPEYIEQLVKDLGAIELAWADVKLGVHFLGEKLVREGDHDDEIAVGGILSRLSDALDPHMYKLSTIMTQLRQQVQDAQ